MSLLSDDQKVSWRFFTAMAPYPKLPWRFRRFVWRADPALSVKSAQGLRLLVDLPGNVAKRHSLLMVMRSSKTIVGLPRLVNLTVALALPGALSLTAMSKSEISHS
jgi:hypothetical protein